MAETLVEFSVKGESDCAVAGSWDEDDEQYDPKRRIVLFEASKLPEILVKVKEFISEV